MAESRGSSIDAEQLFPRSRSQSGSSKVVLIGEEEVGKTALFGRLCGLPFDEERRTTRGIDERKITIQHSDGVRLIHLWDTAGSEKYGSMTLSYYRDSMVAVLVYAVDKKVSLPQLRHWIADVKMFAPTACMILVGNKIDKFHETTIDLDDLLTEDVALQFEANFKADIKYSCRVSAKSGEGMESLKDLLCKTLHGRETETSAIGRPTSHHENNLVDDEVIRLAQVRSSPSPSSKRSCCRKG